LRIHNLFGFLCSICENVKIELSRGEKVPTNKNSCESQKFLAEVIIASSVSPSSFPPAARMFYPEGTTASSDRREDRVGHILAAKNFLASNIKLDFAAVVTVIFC